MNDRGLRLAVAASGGAGWNLGRRTAVCPRELPSMAGQCWCRRAKPARPIPESPPTRRWPHPVIPARLPAFSLSDLAGKPTPIISWSGQVAW